jgi:hypothetical protein
MGQVRVIVQGILRLWRYLVYRGVRQRSHYAFLRNEVHHARRAHLRQMLRQAARADTT